MPPLCVAALDAVHVTLCGNEVFRGISLCLNPGALTVIGGGAACGKTALVRVLCGVIQPTQGQFIGGGLDLTDGSPHRRALWRRKIGIVTREFPLFPDWTVWENLAAAVYTGSPVPREVAAERINRQLIRWGLLSKRHVATKRLAESERARTALARALVRHPIAAFLDEPLADIPANEERQAVMTQLRQEARYGTAIVVTTSHWEDWTPLADELYLIEHGRLRRLPTAMAETG